MREGKKRRNTMIETARRRTYRTAEMTITASESTISELRDLIERIASVAGPDLVPHVVDQILRPGLARCRRELGDAAPRRRRRTEQAPAGLFDAEAA